MPSFPDMPCSVTPLPLLTLLLLLHIPHRPDKILPALGAPPACALLPFSQFYFGPGLSGSRLVSSLAWLAPRTVDRVLGKEPNWKGEIKSDSLPSVVVLCRQPVGPLPSVSSSPLPHPCGSGSGATSSRGDGACEARGPGGGTWLYCPRVSGVRRAFCAQHLDSSHMEMGSHS